MTLIGGHVEAGTPAPHGASWFSSTQLSAESAPRITMPAPVEIDTSLAPGAAPWSLPPSVSVVGRPPTIPLTWVPCPPTESVSVSMVAGSRWTEQVSVSGSHSALRLATTALEPSASLK